LRMRLPSRPCEPDRWPPPRPERPDRRGMPNPFTWRPTYSASCFLRNKFSPASWPRDRAAAETSCRKSPARRRTVRAARFRRRPRRPRPCAYARRASPARYRRRSAERLQRRLHDADVRVAEHTPVNVLSLSAAVAEGACRSPRDAPSETLCSRGHPGRPARRSRRTSRTSASGSAGLGRNAFAPSINDSREWRAPRLPESTMIGSCAVVSQLRIARITS
jgi:hypothetical protein